MTVSDYIFDAVARILDVAVPLLRRTPGGVTDATAYAKYRRVLDRIAADTRAAARSGTLGPDLAAIVSGYREASTDAQSVIAGLERLATAMRAHVPVAATSGTRALQRQNEIALAGLLETLAIANVALAVSGLTLRSHDEATRLRHRLTRAFDLAIERASDRADIDTMRALRETHAKLVRDLIERGRPLARIVAFETAVPLPSVVIAHRLYQDAGRAGELRLENAGHDHPSFMPMQGRAYSR